MLIPIRQKFSLSERAAQKWVVTAAILGVTSFSANSIASIVSLATENAFTLGSPSQPGGNTVVTLNSPVVNGVGGYAVITKNSTGTSNLTNFIYGNATAGNPAILVGQAAVPIGNGNTLADYTFSGFGSYSLANDGSTLFTFGTTRINNVAPSVNAILLQTPGAANPAVIAYDGQQIGGSSAFANYYYGFRQNTTNITSLGVPKITQSGDAYYYISSVSSSSAITSGADAGTAIFRNTPGSSGPSIVLKTGDSITGGTSGLAVNSATTGSIDTSNFGISASGTRYIDKVTTNLGSTVLVTGTPSTSPQLLLTQGSIAAGGTNNETWTGFNRAAINDSGTTAVVGSVSFGSSNYAVAINGMVQFESSSTLPLAGGGTYTLPGSTTLSPDIRLNTNGDYATIYQAGNSGTAKLIFDGIVVAQAGTMYDSNGDGINDTTLTGVSGGRSLAIGDLQPNGTIGLYYFGNINGSSTNILLRQTITVGDANVDGKIDGSDYSLIDNGYLQYLTGWTNGDFNHDGFVNGSDYTLMDNAYNTQSPSAAPAAVTTSQIGNTGISSVPEPASLGLALLAASAMIGRRRRHRYDLHAKFQRYQPNQTF